MCFATVYNHVFRFSLSFVIVCEAWRTQCLKPCIPVAIVLRVCCIGSNVASFSSAANHHSTCCSWIRTRIFSNFYVRLS